MKSKPIVLANVFAAILIAAIAINLWLVATALMAALAHTLPGSGLPPSSPVGIKIAIAAAICAVGWFLGRMILLRLIDSEFRVSGAVSNAFGLTLLIALAAIGLTFLPEIHWTLLAIFFLLGASLCTKLLWQLIRSAGLGVESKQI